MPKSRNLKQKYALINAVRAQKTLYDPKHPDFKSNSDVWAKVAEQCGIKRGQVAKILWKKIREAYRANQKNPERYPSKTYCMFFKHMKFLDPYLYNNNRKVENSTVSDPKVNTEIEVKTNENIHDVEPINMNETTTNREFTTIQYWNETKDDSENVTNIENNAPLKPVNESCSEVNSQSESDIESYEDILPDALKNGSIDKSLKMFFDAMFASTSQLPKVIQRKVKREIFSAILEAEEEAEKQKNNVTTGTNCILIKDEFN